MEHRASTRARHLTLFLAVPFVSFHVRFFLSSSAILVRLQVCWGLLFYHLSTLTSLKQCPYVPLPDLHTRFWRQQFNRQFMRHSLLRTLLQPGVSALYPCFPTGCSGNSNFGFCNKFLFPGAGYQPAAQPPTWRTRGCSSSGLYPSTNPAWLDLPGTTVPAGTALKVIETHKLHHRDKVSAQGVSPIIIIIIIKSTISLIVIGLKNSYFPLIHLSSCYRTVCYRTPFFRTVQ